MVGVQRIVGLVAKAIEPRRAERRQVERRGAAVAVAQDRRTGRDRRVRDRRAFG
jgi:hypothetical protein